MKMGKTENKSKKKKPQENTGRKATITWISLICFVSAWMFMLGIFVGRGTVPVRFDIENLQKELASLKELVIKEGQKRFEIGRDSADTKMELDFYETLKETKAPAKHKVKPPAKVKHPAKVKPPASEKKSLPQKIKTKQNSEKIKKPALITEQTKSKVNEGFTIQVVSLKSIKAASGIAEKLKKKGYQAYTVSVNIPEKGIWHRVRIGHFKTRKDAGRVISRLKKEKYKPIVVQE